MGRIVGVGLCLGLFVGCAGEPETASDSEICLEAFDCVVENCTFPAAELDALGDRPTYCASGVGLTPELEDDCGLVEGCVECKRCESERYICSDPCSLLIGVERDVCFDACEDAMIDCLQDCQNEGACPDDGECTPGPIPCSPGPWECPPVVEPEDYCSEQYVPGNAWDAEREAIMADFEACQENCAGSPVTILPMTPAEEGALRGEACLNPDTPGPTCDERRAQCETLL